MKKTHSHFPSIASDYDFPHLEEEVQRFWDEHGVPRLSWNRDAPRGNFVFYEGPPTANNIPHMGHALTRAVKDLFPRYRTMRGYRVRRKAGWDTHGLPVELAIEKKLGFEGKDAIEAYGVAEFNAQCFENVRKYEREWARVSQRIGMWLDFDDAYFTFSNDYIESIWWILGQMWSRDLLYQGYKVLPYCPHCGTTLSSHEVAQGYRDIKDPSVYIKFRVRPGQEIRGMKGGKLVADGSLYLLAWTTTPWTLPANVALAVHPDVTYQIVPSAFEPGVHYLIADGLELPVDEPGKDDDGKPCDRDLRTQPAVLSVKGRDLEGLRFERLYDWSGEPEDKAWYVVAADYVTLSDGTGIVHLAPAHGQDDYRVCTEKGLPFVVIVRPDGTFGENAPLVEGKWFKDADADIIVDLKRRGLLFRSRKIEHSYPHCWRHHTPLFYYASSSWFIRTTAKRDELLANNQKIEWFPSHIKDGRFGNWLKNVVDWAVSRKRYWGTPLPIWICDRCGHQVLIDSYAALFAAVGRPLPDDVYDQSQFNPHRPYVDEMTWACSECSSGTMRRVPEVLDCWFDSGSMPFAQYHYPFENKELIDSGAQHPADYISEGIDQTRGWFYTLHAVSTILTGKPAFRNCIVMGHILDEDGRKMSKSLGNVVDPMESLNALGADTVRWYFFSNINVGQSARYSERLVRESARSFLIPLWNALSFFTIYANIDGWKPDGKDGCAATDPMDRWILSRLNRLNVELIDHLDHYRIHESARAIEGFVDDLNNWYIRRSRRRFWDSEDPSQPDAYRTLHRVLCRLTLLIAPFTPFIAEYIYQRLERPFVEDAPVSVHLRDYPEPAMNAIDAELEGAMAAVQRVVRLGHAARNQSRIKVRQPLSRLTIVTLDASLKEALESFEDVILEELNIKGIEWASDRGAFVSFAVKPNFKALGPRFGRKMPSLKAAILEADAARLADELEKRGCARLDFEGEQIELSADELEVVMQQSPGTSTAGDESLLVVLDTTISPELRLEGLAREVGSRIQALRKERNLEYHQRIRLECRAEGELFDALEAHSETLAAETLAVAFRIERSSSRLDPDIQTEIEGMPLAVWMEMA